MSHSSDQPAYAVTQLLHPHTLKSLPIYVKTPQQIESSKFEGNAAGFEIGMRLRVGIPITN